MYAHSFNNTSITIFQNLENIFICFQTDSPLKMFYFISIHRKIYYHFKLISIAKAHLTPVIDVFSLLKEKLTPVRFTLKKICSTHSFIKCFKQISSYYG